MLEVKKVEGVLGQNLNECHLDSKGFYFQKLNDDNFYCIEHKTLDTRVVGITKQRIRNFYKVEGNLYISDENSRVSQFLESGEFRFLLGDICSSLKNSVESKYILGYGMEDFRILDTNIIDILSVEKISSYHGIIKMIYKSLLFFHDNGTIFCKEINNKKIKDLWKLRIADVLKNEDSETEENEYKIDHIVGINNEIIWIALKSERVLGICIKTGKVLYDLAEILNTYYNNNGTKLHFYLKDYLVIDDHRNLLIALVGKSYFEISFEGDSPVLKNVDFSEELSSFGPFDFEQNQTGYLPLDKGKLVGVDKMSGKICLIDLLTMKIIFHFDLGLNETIRGKIISSVWITDNLIYVLDTVNNLTILKFEENVEN
ncbi:MAG: hypothetical protein R2784_10665 [Saprospiraceae bacterium]